MRVPKIAVLALYGVSLAATTWQVSTNGADNPACGTSASPCQTIQFTIDNRAASGDRIVIAAGVYQEHLTIPINLTLSGAGTADTLIDGTLTGPVVTISGNRSVTLNQLTVQRGLNLRCGGGIVNHGKLTLVRTSVSDNRAMGVDVLPGLGGGICSQGSMVAIASTIARNVALEGGGIYNLGTSCLLLGSTLSENTSQSFGGAAENFGPLYLVNSTVSGNRAIYGAGFYNAGTLVVDSSTISDNAATDGGGIFNSSVAPDSVILKNSILAGNRSPISPDCLNKITSQDYNLVGDLTNCVVTGGAHDLLGVSPNLGPLQDNSGPTYTMALLPGSPAIDGANPAGCTTSAGKAIRNDQRGLPRSQPGDPVCDIGSFELQR